MTSWTWWSPSSAPWTPVDEYHTQVLLGAAALRRPLSVARMLLARIDASPQRLGDFRYNALPFEIPWGRVVVPSRSRAAIRHAHRAAGRDTASDRRAGGAAARAVRGESAPQYVCQRERIDSACQYVVEGRSTTPSASFWSKLSRRSPQRSRSLQEIRSRLEPGPAHGPRRPHALRA